MKPAPDRQAGYTIIETMLFLAISAFLVVGAMALFNGRISRTQFTQAVQAFDARIKTTANEVATGTYPDFPKFNCSAAGGTGDPVISSGNGTQGSRSDCIFVGKIIAPDSTCGALNTTDCSKVDIYTAVGRRLSSSNQVSTSLTGPNGARPTLLVDDPDLTQTIDLSYGTRITAISQRTSLFAIGVSGVGFFQSFNGSYNSNGSLGSGAQNVETWVVRDTIGISPLPPISKAVMAGDVHGETKLTQPQTSGNVYICLKSAGGGQYASIEILSANGSVSTNMEIGGTLCKNGN